MRIHRPRDPAEAVRIAAEAGGAARFVAGGTALQLDWAKGAERPAALVDLAGMPALGTWGVDRGIVRLGAGLRLSTLEADIAFGAALPLLRATLGDVAAPGIRHRATLGGNVAGRAGCLLPALLALDADLEIAGPAGTRMESLDAWLAGPEDPAALLVAVRLRPQRPGDRWVHRKIGLRAAFTPSVVGVAGLFAFEGERIERAALSVGGGINRPQRLRAVEAGLAGSAPAAIDRKTLRAAICAAFEAPSDAVRTGRYRRLAAAHALVDGLLGTEPGDPPAPMRRPAPAAGAPNEVRVSRATMPGRWRVRPDVADKVHGRTAYLTDHRRPGMLVGRILRAGVPHARIRALDTAAAAALPGVVAVVTAADVPGLNGFGIIVQDQPALCDAKVRFVGDAVAAVAAVDADTAARALALIRVDYEALPTVTDPAAALEADAPKVHASGNLASAMAFSRGDLAAGFSASAHIVETLYVTPRQMHGFMETEGGYVVPEADGSLSVCVGGQHGARDRMQLARILARPEASIRVVTSPIGGGFGGKDELTVQPALALLALKSGRPVRLHLDRAESVASGIRSNPMRIRMRTGCDAQGRLLAQEVDLLVDGGAYASLSPAVLETALEHACGPYLVPNVETRGQLAFTNNGRCGAFRGFGANQVTFAIEAQMGRLAAMAGLDPVAFRRRNLRAPGSPGYLGHAVGPSERLVEMLDAAAASPLWSARDAGGPGMLVGTGLAINHQGTGLGSIVADDGAVRLRLTPEGRIEAAYGLDEMGQGVLTAIKEVVAAALGCGRDDVEPLTGDTALTPDSGSTSAARGTYVIWRGAQEAAPALGAALRQAAATRLGRDPDDLAVAPGGLREARSNSGALLLAFADLARGIDPAALPAAAARYGFPKADYAAGNARFLFAFGAAVARVTVDPATGMVRVLDLHQHTAAGPIVEPAAYLGQIEGGNLQGLGFTLTEDAAMVEGRYAATNLDGYMLPTIADAPARTAVFALVDLDPGDPHGPRGVGEIGIGAVTPAIAAAVADATGVWPATMPIDPEALLDAMAARPRGPQ